MAAGMGLIGHALAGAAVGFGGAAGAYAKESFLEAEKVAAQKLRDQTLHEMQKARDISLNDMAKQREIEAEERKRAPGIRAARAAEGLISSGVQAVNQGATDEAAALAGGGAPITAQTKLSDKDEARIRARTYAAEGLEDSAYRFSQEARQIERDEKETEWRKADRLERKLEGEANRASHREIVELQRKSAERIAGMQASIQREIAKMGTTSQVLNDGSIVTIGRDGKSVDYVRDPITGERLIGKKDLPESSLALIRSLSAENKGHEAIIKDSLSSPEQRAAATKQIRENADEMYRLAGVEKPAKAPSTKTGWDSETKEVFVNGKSIGTAPTEAEGRAMAAKAKASTLPSAKAQSAAPSAQSATPAEVPVYTPRTPPKVGLVEGAERAGASINKVIDGERLRYIKGRIAEDAAGGVPLRESELTEAVNAGLLRRQ